MKRSIAAAVAFVVAMAGLVVYSGYRSYKATEGFKRVEIGTPEEQVRALMGRPTKVVDRGSERYWSSAVEESVKEYHYEPTVLPEIWVIGFDAQNTVVYRNHNLM